MEVIIPRPVMATRRGTTFSSIGFIGTNFYHPVGMDGLFTNFDSLVKTKGFSLTEAQGTQRKKLKERII